jgi:sugar O-acyltransferase (sialic acid O-acetyltransferase NeuD family)
MARIAEAMLRELSVGEPALIFDETLARPAFRTSTPFLGDSRLLKAHLKALTHFVVCIGAEHGYARVVTARTLQAAGLQPLALQHPTSFIDPTARVKAGAQIMPGAIVHKFVRIGPQVLLNTGCTVDHECVLGQGVHVMGSAAIAGRVRIGDFATVGTNATVLPGLRLGKGAYVGAGAVVTADVAPYAVVAGAPARLLRRHELQLFRRTLDLLGLAEGPPS